MCLIQQPDAYAHGPSADVDAYAQGGFYNGNGRVAKAGASARATTGAVGGYITYVANHERS